MSGTKDDVAKAAEAAEAGDATAAAPATVEDEDDSEPAFIDMNDNNYERIDIPDYDEAPPEDSDEEEEANEDEEEKAEEQVIEVDNQSVAGFFRHKDAVFAVGVSPAVSGRPAWVVSGDGADGAETAHVWELATGKLVHTLTGHSDSVTSCKFSSDGKYVATGSMDSSIRVYTAHDGKLLHALEGPSAEVEWIQWHPKGPVIVAGSSDATVWMWNAASGACMRVFSGHAAGVLCGAFSFNGMVVCTGCEDGSLFIWSPKTGNATHKFIQSKGKAFHEAPVTALDTHPADSLVLTGAEDGSLLVSNYTTGKVVTKLGGHKEGVESVSFCSTLKLAASGSIDKTIKIWDLATGQQRAECSHEDAVVSIRWHPTKPLLYSVSADNTLRLWDGRSGELLRKWTGHKDIVLAFDLTADGETIVTASDDKTCLVFSTELADGTLSSNPK